MNHGARSPEAVGLSVRIARAVDAAVLAGFNHAMARETEGRDLGERTVRDGVSAVIADPSHGFYLVAELAGRVVGALLVTFEWSDWRNGQFWWIQSVYVEPGARGRGVYRELHSFVRALASDRGGVCGLRLYVEKDNRAAQNVYRALGMHESGYRLYEQELEQ